MFEYDPNQELLDYLGTAMLEFPAAQADLIAFQIQQQNQQQVGLYNDDLSEDESDDYTLKLTR